MNEHTPGPWIATPDPYSMQDGDYMIGREGHKPDEVAVCSKRDASLIAAAPELLDALIALYDDALELDIEKRPLYVAARDAIAKATGATP